MTLYSSADTEVFIVYGENISPDDRVFTNPDGDFAFNWLERESILFMSILKTLVNLRLVDPLLKLPYYKVLIEDRKDEVDIGTIIHYLRQLAINMRLLATILLLLLRKRSSTPNGLITALGLLYLYFKKMLVKRLLQLILQRWDRDFTED